MRFGEWEGRDARDKNAQSGAIKRQEYCYTGVPWEANTGQRFQAASAWFCLSFPSMCPLSISLLYFPIFCIKWSASFMDPIFQNFSFQCMSERWGHKAASSRGKVHTVCRPSRMRRSILMSASAILQSCCRESSSTPEWDAPSQLTPFPPKA